MHNLIDNKDEDIKVSVYCLAYNHEKYIRKTLEGFVMQKTSFQYEVIVHDDASTDGTPDIIKEYADKYPNIIRPIFQKQNQYSKGTKIVSTYILPIMHGKYIASCEGDDYWNDDNKLQKQFEAMEMHPECSISTHKVQCCNEDGTFSTKIIPEKCYRLKESGIIKGRELAECYWIRGEYPFHTSSFFYRRNILDIDLEYPREVGTLRKCLISGWVYYIDEAMSVRRLWAIDSWSSKLRNNGVQGLWDFVLQKNAEEDRFDQYTNFKYHDFIEIGKLSRLIPYAQYPEYHSKVKELLEEHKLSPWKIRSKISICMFIKLQTKYAIAIYFPNCYHAIKTLRYVLGRHSKN